MAKGTWEATAASTAIIAANAYRDQLLIQKLDVGCVAVSLGIGEAAIAGEGVQLVNVYDTIILHGAAARGAVYAIGDGGSGTYQDGDVEYRTGPLAL